MGGRRFRSINNPRRMFILMCVNVDLRGGNFNPGCPPHLAGPVLAGINTAETFRDNLTIIVNPSSLFGF